ncbi:MAG: serine/threonine-protein kinase, partial [Desulfobacterales bacterium]
MKTIGKYIIRGLLGRGGMSKIYKVEHPVIGKIAALKYLDPDPLLVKLMGMDGIRAMFVAEAVTMAGLRHPNIVEIVDFNEADGRPYYLMAYFANNLRLMIGESNHPDEPSRPLRVDKALHYTRQTLQGLACLHYAGIIHRDIKPANLLITDQDAVKICDFGLSKLHGEKFAGPPSLKVGSAWYAPPEQETDPDRVDLTADLFSVGLTFYRLLTGVLPSGDYRPVAQFNSDLDAIWDGFIRKAIARRAEDRFSSAPEMLAAL